MAVNASRTVELRFTGHFVPAELVSWRHAARGVAGQGRGGLRPNGSLALGVAGRCCQLLGQLAGSAAQASGAAGLLAAELAARRAALDAAASAGIRRVALPAARAAASVAGVPGRRGPGGGSRAATSILAGEHPQRLAREALFLLVFGSRPAIKERLVALLTARGAIAGGPDCGWHGQLTRSGRIDVCPNCPR